MEYPGVHPLRAPELRALRQLHRESEPSPYLFTTGARGDPIPNPQHDIVSSISPEQQRQFVSDVCYELRTPLTLVQGYLQSLLRQVTITEPQQEALSCLLRSGPYIHLLQDLLDLARA